MKCFFFLIVNFFSRNNLRNNLNIFRVDLWSIIDLRKQLFLYNYRSQTIIEHDNYCVFQFRSKSFSNDFLKAKLLTADIQS